VLELGAQGGLQRSARKVLQALDGKRDL